MTKFDSRIGANLVRCDLSPKEQPPQPAGRIGPGSQAILPLLRLGDIASHLAVDGIVVIEAARYAKINPLGKSAEATHAFART